MARIIIITSTIGSAPSLAMALRLQKDGHEVTYASFNHTDLHKRFENLQFIKLPNLQKLTENTATSAQDLKTVIAGFPSIFGADKYDLSIVDIECHEYIVSSPVFSNKVVLLSTFLSMWRRPGLPPLHLATQPDSTKPQASNFFTFTWFRYLFLKILRNRLSKLKKLGKDRLSNLAKIAIYSKFPWKEKKDEAQWLKPVFYKDIPVLCFNNPALDFPHKPNSDALYIGPMFNLEHAEEHATLNDPEKTRLKTVLDTNKAAKNRPLIYCSFGRFKKSYSDSFVNKVVNTAKQRPDWDFLIAFGGHESHLATNELPVNAHVFQWLPQKTVLQLSNCAVIHSGISSINECINAKVPMVLYSLGILDQEGNAARVVFHKLGVSGSRDSDTSKGIEKNILLAMQSDEISKALTKFNQQASLIESQKVLEKSVNSILESS